MLNRITNTLKVCCQTVPVLQAPTTTSWTCIKCPGDIFVGNELNTRMEDYAYCLSTSINQSHGPAIYVSRLPRQKILKEKNKKIRINFPPTVLAPRPLLLPCKKRALSPTGGPVILICPEAHHSLIRHWFQE